MMIKRRIISFAIMFALFSALASPVAMAYPPDGVDWPYLEDWPDCIDRRDVPIEVPPADPLEPGMDSLVVKTYPEGRMKAFLFAFDDGGTFLSKPGDNYVLSILNQHHLRGTFYLMMANGYVSSGKGIYQDMGYPPTAEGYKQAIREIYAGHEVGTHTLTGLSIDLVNFDSFKYETSESKRRFEECINGEVAGMAYHYKDGNPNPSENNATQEEKDEYLKSIGYRYTRRSIRAANEPHTFDIPDNFFNWLYDYRIIDNSDDNVNIILPNYFALDTKNEMKVMTYFAHSWQIEGEGESKAKIRANFEIMCQMLEDHKDDIWNTTYIDFVDYVNATRQLDIHFINDGDIYIHNPSKEITCWVDILGDDIAVAPGKTITIDNPIEIGYEPSEYVAHINTNPDVEDGVYLSEIGTTQVVTDNADVQINNDGKVEIRQTSASQDSDYIMLTDPWLINPMKPTMIDVTYRVSADSYNDNTPLTAMAFSMPTIGLVGKAKPSSLPVQPTQESSEGYKMLRIAIDHPNKTVYVSDNGGAYVTIPYPYDISYLRNLRLYPMAYAADGSGNDGDVLATPVTWTFDSIRVYQPKESDLLKIASMKTSSRFGNLEYQLDTTPEGSKVNFAINVRNYGVANKDFTVIAALYQSTDKGLTLKNITLKSFEDIKPMFIANYKDSFDLSNISGNYTIKAFVWDGLNSSLYPYDYLIRNGTITPTPVTE